MTVRDLAAPRLGPMSPDVLTKEEHGHGTHDNAPMMADTEWTSNEGCAVKVDGLCFKCTVPSYRAGLCDEKAR